MQEGYRCGDATEVVPIKQIGVAIFPQCNHEMGGCRARHVYQQWTAATQICVAIIELEPIGRRPVITRIAAKDRTRLEPDHCFAATPVPSSSGSVTGGNKRIRSCRHWQPRQRPIYRRDANFR